MPWNCLEDKHFAWACWALFVHGVAAAVVVLYIWWQFRLLVSEKRLNWETIGWNKDNTKRITPTEEETHMLQKVNIEAFRGDVDRRNRLFERKFFFRIVCTQVASVKQIVIKCPWMRRFKTHERFTAVKFMLSPITSESKKKTTDFEANRNHYPFKWRWAIMLGLVFKSQSLCREFIDLVSSRQSKLRDISFMQHPLPFFFAFSEGLLSCKAQWRLRTIMMRLTMICGTWHLSLNLVSTNPVKNFCWNLRELSTRGKDWINIDSTCEDEWILKFTPIAKWANKK